MVVAMALLVIGACLALVFDRLWLDAAQIELQAAAEAAALAGAGQLATDARLLKEPGDLESAARSAAIAIGQKNHAVGSPVDLFDGEQGDVQVGSIVMSPENGQMEFVTETDRLTTCVVRAARLENRGNPVALFFRQLTSNTQGNAQAFAEASVDNRIIGVQPGERSPVPALPVAILLAHPDPRRHDTWQRQIDMKLGLDRYRFDASTGEVVAGPDGIPEMMLHGASPSAEAEDCEKANLLTIDSGNGLHEQRVITQIENGWTVEDLKPFGEEFRTDQGPQRLDVDAAMIGTLQDRLEALIGQTRICGVYMEHKSTSRTLGQASMVNLVGIRILAVENAGGQQVHLTIQPAVVATRTALLGTQETAWDSGESDPSANPYIYKLFLSH